MQKNKGIISYLGFVVVGFIIFIGGFLLSHSNRIIVDAPVDNSYVNEVEHVSENSPESLGDTIGSIDLWKTQTTAGTTTITQRVFGRKVKITGLETGTCLTLDGNSILATTTCGGSSTWGAITGILSDQTDLQAALDSKVSTSSLSFTPGSILFASSTGTITQDNSNFFWDDTNNRLGIGGTPSYKFHVQDATGSVIRNTSGTRFIQLASYSADTNYLDSQGSQFRIRTLDNQPIQFYTNNINFASFLGGEPTLQLDSNAANSTNAGKIIFRTASGSESFTQTFNASTNRFHMLYGATNIVNISQAGFGIGTTAFSPVYRFDLIDTSSNQHRIGYNTSNYLDTRVFSTGGVILKAVGSAPYVQLGSGSSWMQQTQGGLYVYNPSGNLYLQSDDTGAYFSSNVWAVKEFGFYSGNGDETIASYDWNTYEWYYFNRALYGNDSTIKSNAIFQITNSSGNPQLSVGQDFDNLFQTNVASDGNVNFYANSLSITPEFTFNNAVNVPDEAYGSGWDGNTEVPTKNALYDKIETLSGGSVATSTVQNMATLGLADNVVPYYSASSLSFASSSLYRSGSSLYTSTGNLSLATSTAHGRLHVWQATGSEFFTRNSGTGIILMNHNAGKDIGFAASQNYAGAAGWSNLGNGSVGIRLLEGSGSAGSGTVSLWSDGAEGFTFKAGNVGIATTTPGAKVTVQNGDVYIASSTRGIILKSPDGTCARGTISNLDVLTFSSVTCP